MTHTLPATYARLSKRMCLSCGYDGLELQRGQPSCWTCPECHADLYSRPPRSYAELEGFQVHPTALPREHWNGTGPHAARLRRALAHDTVRSARSIPRPLAIGAAAFVIVASIATLTLLILAPLG